MTFPYNEPPSRPDNRVFFTISGKFCTKLRSTSWLPAARCVGDQTKTEKLERCTRYFPDLLRSIESVNTYQVALFRLKGNSGSGPTKAQKHWNSIFMFLRLQRSAPIQSGCGLISRLRPEESGPVQNWSFCSVVGIECSQSSIFTQDVFSAFLIVR